MGSVANPFLISGLMLEPMSTGRIKRVTKTHVLIQTPNLKPQTSNLKLQTSSNNLIVILIVYY